MVHIDLPQDVSSILGVLRRAGYEAYAVGGCVRDSLIGKKPKDWDITTSALPEEVKGLFSRTIDTGIKHGTVTVMVNSTGYEVTTYRVDGEYLDGRHPEEVEFTANLSEDLKRRDFTINAFVYNEEEGIIDLFGGLEDLRNGVIRCVGVPEERFGEDALRILRAIRFAASLSFSIEPGTYRAAGTLAGNLKKVSAERIRTELEKTLISDNPDYICMLRDLGIDRAILDELIALSGEESLKKALKASVSEPAVRWAVLCFFIEKDGGLETAPGSISKGMMQRLKFDNRTMDRVLLFLKTFKEFGHTGLYPDGDMGVFGRRLLNVVGAEDIYYYLDFASAVTLQQTGQGAESQNLQMPYSIKKDIRDCVRGILERDECYSLKQLAVNGRDIQKELGIKGKEVGEKLDYLLGLVIASPEKNSREYLLEVAKAYGQGL